MLSYATMQLSLPPPILKEHLHVQYSCILNAIVIALYLTMHLTIHLNIANIIAVVLLWMFSIIPE